MSAVTDPNISNIFFEDRFGLLVDPPNPVYSARGASWRCPIPLAIGSVQFLSTAVFSQRRRGFPTSATPLFNRSVVFGNHRTCFRNRERSSCFPRYATKQKRRYERQFCLSLHISQKLAHLLDVREKIAHIQHYFYQFTSPKKCSA